jgi:hypothetical protein
MVASFFIGKAARRHNAAARKRGGIAERGSTSDISVAGLKSAQLCKTT